MKILTVIACAVSMLLAPVSTVLALGPAFSGIAANADSAETVVRNPAGMTRFNEPAIYGNPMVIYTKSSTEISASGTDQKEKIDNDSFVAMPGLYYVRPLSERWAIGIGPTAFTGLGSTYDDEWAGRYLLKEWSLNFVGLAPSVAYRFNDKVSIGASVPITYSQYTFEKAVYNLDPAANDGSMELDADGWGAGFTFGVLYELTEHSRFGLVYRSKISITDEGNPDFSGLTEERKQLLNQFGALDQTISFDTSTPQMVNAGVFHEIGCGWSFSVDLLWVDFSEWGLENVEIGDSEISSRPGNYQDIWGSSLGINFAFTPVWTARSGVFYLSSALDDEDRTAFSRFDAMWGTGLGLEYQIRKGRSISFDLTYLQFGDGKFTQDIPTGGEIQGEYTTNYAIVFGIGTQW